jgi:hypothetical protein
MENLPNIAFNGFTTYYQIKISLAINKKVMLQNMTSWLNEDVLIGLDPNILTFEYVGLKIKVSE